MATLSHPYLEPVGSANRQAHSLGRMAFTASVGLIAAVILLRDLALHGFSGDLLMDIANGRWILAHHAVPLRNVLTQAQAGAPWGNPEWLFGVYAAWLYGLGGKTAVFWGLAPIVAATALLVSALAARAGRVWQIPITVLAAIGIEIGMSPRPQLLSYLLFAFGIWAIFRYREGSRWPVWVFAGSTLLWTNVHASALLAPALLLAEALLGAPDRRRSLWGPAVLAALLIPLHPGGLGGGTGFLSGVLNPAVVNTISEWQPIDLLHYPGILEAPWLYLSLFFLPWAARRNGDEPGSFWALGGALASAFAIRFSVYLVIAAAALLAVYLPDRLKQAGKHPVTVLAAIAGVAVLFSLSAVSWVRSLQNPLPVVEPVGAIRYLQTHGATNVLPFYQLGDALDFYGPRPFLDGRAELWSRQKWWMPYVRLTFGQGSIAGWMQKYDPQARWIIWPLSPGLSRRLPGWRLRYVDRTVPVPVGVFKQDGKSAPTA